MKLTLTALHFGGIMVRHPAHGTAYFPGRPGGKGTQWTGILTGARDRWGNNRVMSAHDLAGYYRVRSKWWRKAKPGDTIVVPDDKGLFDRITAEDIIRHRRHARGCMPVSVATWSKAFHGVAAKTRRVLKV